MTHEELAAAEPISFLTAAGFSHQDVAALSHYIAHDVAIGDFRLCGNPCSSGLLFKGCVVAGVVELRKFGVTSREITEQYHCFTVQLPRQLHKPIPRRCPQRLNMCSASTPWEPTNDHARLR